MLSPRRVETAHPRTAAITYKTSGSSSSSGNYRQGGRSRDAQGQSSSNTSNNNEEDGSHCRESGKLVRWDCLDGDVYAEHRRLNKENGKGDKFTDVWSCISKSTGTKRGSLPALKMGPGCVVPEI